MMYALEQMADYWAQVMIVELWARSSAGQQAIGMLVGEYWQPHLAMFDRVTFFAGGDDR